MPKLQRFREDFRCAAREVGMRDYGAEAYKSYVKMCERLGCPILGREAYEKSTQHVQHTVVNADIVLMNNNRKKDA